MRSTAQDDGTVQRGPPSYRPIFMMHGLGVSADWDCGAMAGWVKQAHPGTATYPIALYEDWPASATALDIQIQKVAEYIRKEVNATPALFVDGYNLVCHSQGALICRILAQYMDDHRIHTIVSLAGPQLGVYGSDYFSALRKVPIIERYTYEDIYEFAYTELAQKTLSVANMWSDPVHHDEFVRKATFLAVYNGLTSNLGNAARRANFVRLEKAVFLTGIPSQGDWDGGLEPYFSGVFDYFADGNRTLRVPMKSQYVYTADTFGLRTLDEAGKLVTDAVPNISHRAWVADQSVFTQYILPHLV